MANIIRGYGLDANQILPPDTKIVAKPFTTDTIAQVVWEELEPKPAEAQTPPSKQSSDRQDEQQ